MPRYGALLVGLMDDLETIRDSAERNRWGNKVVFQHDLFTATMNALHVKLNLLNESRLNIQYELSHPDIERPLKAKRARAIAEDIRYLVPDAYNGSLNRRVTDD